MSHVASPIRRVRGADPVVLVHLTRHALHRYQERIRPGADLREAAIVLRDAIRRMTRTDERTPRGEALWVVDRPDMRLVTKHDPFEDKTRSAPSPAVETRDGA